MQTKASSENRNDLERFASRVLKTAGAIEQPTPFEQRLRWDLRGSTGFSSAMQLRSGPKLNATRLRWERPWAFQFREGPSPLKFTLSRGARPQVTRSDGVSYLLGTDALQVRHSRQAVNTTCGFAQDGAEFEQLAIEVEPERLRELWGAATLPNALETLLNGAGDYRRHEQPMVPALFRLMEEILYADSRRASRQLFLEAKGLEVLGALLDEIELASQAMSPLCSRDIDRLQRAGRLLLTHMDAPPSLPELARAVGLNEFKLKAGFRSYFGTSAFGYLREQRMIRARELLVQRDLNVAEVAVRVGYANPSKFASAFRKHFGFPPSAIR